MSVLVPSVGEVLALQKYLQDQNLTLKLYSNNYTPVEGSTHTSFTEVSGGGYSSQILATSDWIITGGDPSEGIQPQKEFEFSGVTSAPGTIYGYYVVDASNVVRWAERFPEAALPFTPIANSVIRITPRFQCS